MGIVQAARLIRSYLFLAIQHRSIHLSTIRSVVIFNISINDSKKNVQSFVVDSNYLLNIQFSI